MYYFFQDSNGQQQGPVAANDLPRYGVTPQTLVWKDGMPAWQAAGTVAELSVFFHSSNNFNEQPHQAQYSPQQQSINQQPQMMIMPPTTINIQGPKTNGIGTAGFVLALLALFLGCIPVLGWICWFLGLLFSFIGVFKEPKGSAIAGLIISLVDLFILLFLIGTITSFF